MKKNKNKSNKNKRKKEKVKKRTRARIRTRNSRIRTRKQYKNITRKIQRKEEAGEDAPYHRQPCIIVMERRSLHTPRATGCQMPGRCSAARRLPCGASIWEVPPPLRQQMPYHQAWSSSFKTYPRMWNGPLRRTTTTSSSAITHRRHITNAQ